MTPRRNPVLLIHGLWDTKAKFNRLTPHLTKLGWSVHSISLNPNKGQVPLETLAYQMSEYIDKTFAPTEVIDLLGFSMGGLVTRYYLQRLGGFKRVQRYINISGPNHGTWAAYFLPYVGVEQMRPESSFLTDLKKDAHEILSQLECTFIWTPFDFLILPPKSTLMSIGMEIKIPVLLHADMTFDDRVIQAVTEALGK